ncbi:ARS-binding protein 2 [Trichoderma ghanense]|uniref:ARS-binding protein 2 n=1 Tax=Trichoderma ghanense TaxID=65468 RepID=A0ABY2H600_9HYPO
MSSPQAVATQTSLAVSNPRPLAARPALPDRNVTPDTIEDAYVRFIFYCNPALPLDADTDSLREAFANPPRSGGKSFSPFLIFDLVQRFYRKEIKTWTELTTRLGVEPPDLSKDESAQKVAQYGVRLKKWMNSMHVKAFFEYLMDITNDYWTNVPDDPNPTSQPVRDGVAIEDDMALRALLPHIRPKRGRKRPEADDGAGSPVTQRQRLSPPSAVDAPRASWSAHPDARAQGMPMDSLRPGVAAAWGLGDAVHTPLSRYPNSAITPSTGRSSFWDDALEPRSAITPSKPKLSTHRRGPKNVSSAWKPGGGDSSSKPRGRPPINRTPAEPSPPNPPPMTSWAPTPDSNPSDPPLAAVSKEPMPLAPDAAQMHPQIRNQVVAARADPVASMQAAQVRVQPQPPAQVQIIPPPASSSNLGVAGMGINPLDGTRPARPSISLQVPERQGGTVRLATPPLPPSMVSVNGLPANEAPALQGVPNQGLPAPQANGWDPFSQPPTAGVYETNTVPTSAGASQAGSTSREVPRYFFEGLEDRTNVDGLISYFTHVLHNSDWVDPEGNQQEIAGMDECTAMVNATVEHMYRNAESSQAFLINLAALCGAKMLMTNRPRCYRVETSEGVYTYYFDWQYRFGHLKGQFTMTHSVPVTMWKKPSAREAAEASQPGGPSTGENLTTEQWQVKYGALMDELEKRDQELFKMQNIVMASMRRDGG